MSGLLLVVVHSGEKLLAMDDDGYSDPYCIVTANKEKVLHISCTDNPATLNNSFKTDVKQTGFPNFDRCKSGLRKTLRLLMWLLLFNVCSCLLSLNPIMQNPFCFRPLKCKTKSKNRHLANTFSNASCMFFLYCICHCNLTLSV